MAQPVDELYVTKRYVYGPVPPETVAVNVTDEPRFIGKVRFGVKDVTLSGDGVPPPPGSLLPPVAST